MTEKPVTDPNKKRAPLYAVLMLLLLSLTLYAGWVSIQPRDPYARYKLATEKLGFHQFTIDNQLITLTVVGVQGIDDNNIKIVSALVKNETGGVVQVVEMQNPVTVVPNSLPTTFSINISALPSNEHFTVTLVTSAGSSFVSPLSDS